MNKIEKDMINETMAQTWKRWQGYTPDQKAERLAYMQQQIVQLKQQRAYAKSRAKTARTPEEQQVWRNTKAQIDKELLRVVSHEHDLRVGKKMSQGAKERATVKRREDRAKAKNRITFQPQDDPYYTNESKNMNKKLIRLTEQDLRSIIRESINSVLNEATRITYKGRIFDYNGDDNREFKRLFAKFKAQVDAAEAAERGEEIQKPTKKTRKRKKSNSDEGIGEESSPRQLALGVKKLIYDVALNSIKVFVTHGERSFGPNAMRQLFTIYKQEAGENLFIKYNSYYREIEKTINEIESWGRKNEHAVYERACKLADLLTNLSDTLIKLCNTTNDLKKSGKLAIFGKSPVLYGRGDGRELGLYNLIFAGRAQNLAKTQELLMQNAELMEKICKNGRNPFDYDPNNLRNRT